MSFPPLLPPIHHLFTYLSYQLYIKGIYDVLSKFGDLFTENTCMEGLLFLFISAFTLGQPEASPFECAGWKGMRNFRVIGEVIQRERKKTYLLPKFKRRLHFKTTYLRARLYKERIF